MKTSTTLLALTLSLGALTTFAQDAGDGRPPGAPPGGPRGGGPRSPLIAALDANKDGKISTSEISNSASTLAALDKNKDGQLGKDELQPARPDGGPGRPGGPDSQGGPGRPEGAGGPRGPGGPGGGRGGFMPPLIAALDANKDGIIAADELKNAPAALKQLDKNNDGELTQEELRGPRPGGEGRGPGGEDRRRPQPPTEP